MGNLATMFLHFNSNCTSKVLSIAPKQIQKFLVMNAMTCKQAIFFQMRQIYIVARQWGFTSLHLRPNINLAIINRNLASAKFVAFLEGSIQQLFLSNAV